MAQPVLDTISTLKCHNALASLRMPEQVRNLPTDNDVATLIEGRVHMSPTVTCGTCLDGVDVVVMVVADTNIQHLKPMIAVVLGRVDVVRSNAVDVGRKSPWHVRCRIRACFE